MSKRLFSRDGWPLWAVLGLGLVVLGIGLGLRLPWPADEPRFVLIAQEMLNTGQWLLPHRAGELYPDKPPFFFWMLAISLWMTGGAIKFAHLLPALCAGLACLVMVYDLSRRLYSRRVATVTALVLLFCFQFAWQMRSSQIDGFLCLWTTLGVYGMCRHLLLGPAWGWYALGGLAMGIGVITKGVGFLPLLILLPYVLMRLRGGWKHLPVIHGSAWQWALAPLALLFGISLWLGPMLFMVATSSDPSYVAYRDNILLKQTVVRYADPWHHYHPFWYYVVNVIPQLWFPFSLLLLWLVPTWVKRFKRRDARIFLPLFLALLILLFFSISRGKRGVYILPALPVMVLAAAPLLHGLLRRKSVRTTAFASMLLLGTVLLAALAYLGWVNPELTEKLMRDMQQVNPWPPLITLACVFIGAALWARPRRGVLAVAAGMTGLWFIFTLWVAPQINFARSGQKVMTSVNQLLPDGAELGMTQWKEQLILNATHPVTQFGYHTPGQRQEFDGAAWLRQAPQKRWLLTPTAGLKPCYDKSKAVFVSHDHRRDWFLVRVNAIKADAPQDCFWAAPKEAWQAPTTLPDDPAVMPAS